MAEGDLQEPGAQQEQSSAAAGLQDANADVGHSAPPAKSAAAPLREDQIQNAVSFLSHPKVCQNTGPPVLMQISVNLAHKQAFAFTIVTMVFQSECFWANPLNILKATPLVIRLHTCPLSPAATLSEAKDC